jgi:hypothetical protein
MADVIGSRGPNRRDYFIGCALQGLVARSAPELPLEHVAKRAVEIGDAVYKAAQTQAESAE